MLYTNLMQGFVMSLSDSSSSATSVLNITSGRFEFGGTNDAYLALASSPNFNLGNSKPGIVNISGGTCVVQKLYGLDLGSSAGGRGYVNITGGELVFTGQTAGTGPYISLGSSGGYGEINISGNGKLTAYSRNFAVGYFPSASYGHLTLNGGSVSLPSSSLALGSRGNDCTGIVTVISGQLTVVGGVGSGILLGYDAYNDGRSEGILEIFGGNVTASPDIYAGYATGNRTNKMGRITITNGFLYVQGSFYVGSATNGGRAAGELNLSDSGIISNTLSLYVGNGTGAVGVFNQTGGRYNQSSGVMYLGYGGDGTFKMSGSQGALTVPALTATTSTSRISFDLGPNGAGTVTVSGAVSISTNTSLEVTVTNYDWSANGLTVDLISYGTLTGVFGATNVTIIGAVGGLDGGSVLYGDGTNDKIKLQLNRRASGTFFKFR